MLGAPPLVYLKIRLKICCILHEHNMIMHTFSLASYSDYFSQLEFYFLCLCTQLVDSETFKVEYIFIIGHISSLNNNQQDSYFNVAFIDPISMTSHMTLSTVPLIQLLVRPMPALVLSFFKFQAGEYSGKRDLDSLIAFVDKHVKGEVKDEL